MYLTQFLIFEAGPDCNLADKHPQCPNSDSARFANTAGRRPVTDDMILDTCRRMYRHYGFRGAVGWHYYNEPLLYADRVFPLMETIRAEIPEARFVLWTNGTMIPSAEPGLDRLGAFDFAWVTNYDGADYSRIRRAVPNATIVRWGLDARKKPGHANSNAPCGRPFSEFVFDCYGQAHLCCIDWRGECDLGNLHDDPLDRIVARFQSARAAVARGLTIDAPEVCRRCEVRHARISSLVPDIATAARDAVRKNALPTRPESGRLDCIAVCMGEMSDDWRAWHEAHDIEVQAAEDDDHAARILRAARTDGIYFACVLSPPERLAGPVLAALRLHPNENLLYVPARHVSPGEPPAETDPVRREPGRIVRLGDFESVAHGRPILRRKAKTREITLEELTILDSRPAPSRRLAVTFTHYRLPASRLADHFRWNDAHYRASGTRVFVVTDREYPVPEYATCLVYPDPMPVFSLAKTSNYGIRYALDAGYGVIVKTDVDLCYTSDSWRALREVDDGSAVVPVYLMAASYAAREIDFVPAPLATGTVSMTAAGWRRARYDERCEGYGSDDAIVVEAIRRQGIDIDRAECARIYHIAHEENTPQKEFDRKNPRVDHWGRADGFNPENFAHNRKFKGQIYDAPGWGLAGCDRLTVVAVHYRLPASRLRNFIAWNRNLFEQYRVRCIIVSDAPRDDVPAWCRVAPFPVDLARFNLAACSNYGIRLAGSGTICKTDIDCIFTAEALDACLSVTPERGVGLRYLMAASPDPAGRAAAELWDQSKGTLCLDFAHWSALRGFDERQDGYGLEDGDGYTRAKMAIDGRTVDRVDAPFYHIAHEYGQPQHRRRRKDFWNRDNGFNPRNHAHNRSRIAAGPWHKTAESAAWGLGCVPPARSCS